ncbi:MAG: L,D-transpeptidase [Candidatus Moranbacteria bacterium]|nr:L,D-transpeptidase [Candidatus Moranbacteria bacterium]
MQQKSNFFLIFTKTFLLSLALASLALIIFYGWQFYQKSYAENVTLKKAKNIEVKEALEVNFSVPVWNKDYATKIKTVPEEKIKLDFDGAKRKLIITPEKFWQSGTDYAIVLPEGRTAMLTKIAGKKLTFSVANFPQVTKVFPTDGTKGVIIGAEDPIIIDFDKSTKDYYVDFQLNPDGGVEYQNNPEKTEFKILPRSKVEDGVQYSLKISIKAAGDSDEHYQALYAGSFETLKTTPVAWEKDFAIRLDQARKYTKAKITTGKYIDVNLTTQIMTTFENGTLLDAYLVSSGKRGMGTPIGTHQIYNKSPRAYSKAYGLYMPNWMAFLADGKMGIHELPEWPGGYKEGANHLGTPVSHGCIRLGVGPAKIVYDWAEIGTPLIVY